MLMICMMSSPVNFFTFLWVRSKRALCLVKIFLKYALVQFYFPLKINFSESNFLKVYAVVHYRNIKASS